VTAVRTGIRISSSAARRCSSTTTTSSAPRGALLYPRRSREELGGGFLGPMAYPDPKGERNNRMPAKRRSCPGVGVRRRGTRVIWRKLDCLISQSPEDAKKRPPERHLLPAPRCATASYRGCRNLRSMERCPARAIKEMSGTPTSRSDVRQGRTRDRLRGASPMATECP
jgi:hypothetical protein